jgi:hypothetical protein
MNSYHQELKRFRCPESVGRTVLEFEAAHLFGGSIQIRNKYVH